MTVADAFCAQLHALCRQYGYAHIDVTVSCDGGSLDPQLFLDLLRLTHLPAHVERATRAHAPRPNRHGVRASSALLVSLRTALIERNERLAVRHRTRVCIGRADARSREIARLWGYA